MSTSTRASRRILAIVVPHILTEIVRGSRCSLLPQKQQKQQPLGICLVDTIESKPRPNEILTAVCPRAARSGVRAGQRLTEARALVSDLQIEHLERKLVEEHLIAIAEVVKTYGTTISWSLPDTVWLDVSGVAHLFGGEQNLAEEVQEQVRLLGHVVRVVIATGPVIAQAICRSTPGQAKSVREADTQEVVQQLPLSALPLDTERLAWLSRLGVITVGQLRALPPKSTASRLGPQAMKLLLLMDGIDETPMIPGVFPEILEENIEWDEPAFGISPLLFAVHGLVSKLQTRLTGRGEACSLIELSLEHDRAICRHLGVLSKTVISFELSSPLHQKSDIERIIKTRLERLQLKAPTVGLRLSVSQLSPQVMNQLSLTAHQIHPSSMPEKGWGQAGQKTASVQEHGISILVAELQADLQKEELGTLALFNSHRPERLSALVPIWDSKERKGPRNCLVKSYPPVFERITRLLPEPQLLCARLQKGECIPWGGQLYVVEKTKFLQRLDRVEWWNTKAVSRDYFWVWLKSPIGSVEALFFSDLSSKKLYLQGFGD